MSPARTLTPEPPAESIGLKRQADNNADHEYDQVITKIVDYVYDTTIDSPRAWVNAKAALLDALGCSYETLELSTECARLIGPVYPSTANTPNGFRLPGTRFQLDMLKGAFDMGVMIRYLDHNDAFLGAEWGHPSGRRFVQRIQVHMLTCLIDNLGAILAVSDVLNRSGQRSISMHTVLSALMKAYEIQGCFQIRNSYNKVGLDHVINVKVASTAVVSWLLGLPKEKASAAVSHAFIDGHSLRTYRHAPNTGPRKGWAGGDAAQRAVHLALLVKAGQPGIKTALTAPHWGFYDVLFKGKAFEFPKNFSSWTIENILFKVNTAEGHALTAVEAALAVVHQLEARSLSVADVTNIRIRTQEAAMDIINKQGPLRNPADRDHCMQYMVAVVLCKGAMIDTEDYQDASPFAQSDEVAQLRSKIKLVEDPQITKDYHNIDIRSATNSLLVTLKDGTKFEECVDFPLGSPKRNETLPLVYKKAAKNLALKLTAARVEEIFALWERPELLEKPVSEVIDMFIPDVANGHA